MTDRVQMSTGEPVEGQTPPGGGQQETPSEQKLLAGKFKSTEELEKGYKELEKKLGQPKETLPPPADKPKDPKDNPLSVPEQAKEAVEGVGLNFEAMQKEFAETGALSEETYASLEKSGIPKAIVDGYIAGQMAAAEKFQNTIYQSVGGEEQYRRMTNWAASNLSDEEKAAFNKAVVGSQGEAMLAVNGLRAAFERANGSTPKLVKGDGASGVSGGYESHQQVVEDMKNPLYRKDPAYRKAVEEKLRRTMESKR